MEPSSNLLRETMMRRAGGGLAAYDACVPRLAATGGECLEEETGLCSLPLMYPVQDGRQTRVRVVCPHAHSNAGSMIGVQRKRAAIRPSPNPLVSSRSL